MTVSDHQNLNICVLIYMHMNSTKLYHYVPQYVHTLPCLFQCLAHGDSLPRSVLRKNMIMMLLSISGNVALNQGPQDVPTTYSTPADFKIRSGLGFVHHSVG